METSLKSPKIISSSGYYQKFQTNPSSSPGPLPKDECIPLTELNQHNIDSFNYLLDNGLSLAVNDLLPERVVYEKESMDFRISEIKIDYPKITDNPNIADTRLLPSMCREAGLTYGGSMTVVFKVNVNGEEYTVDKGMGILPIMVKSNKCHLSGMTPAQLMEAHEESNEFGGYFICNGIERVIRMLQIPRRNFPMVFSRSSYSNRGPLYTDKGITMRCVKHDQFASFVTLHYLSDGRVTLRFSVRKQEYLVPVILIIKAFKQCTDREIYQKIMKGDSSNMFLADRLSIAFREGRDLKIFTQNDALKYLGNRFRLLLDPGDDVADENVGQLILDRFVFIHLNDTNAKFNILLYMLQKLFAYVNNEIAADSQDSLQNQEILLSGHLLNAFIKDRLEFLLLNVKRQLQKDMANTTKKQKEVNLNINMFRNALRTQGELGKRIYLMLATGNLATLSGLGLMQISGFTIIAEKINFWRYLSHFRSVHRGSFFLEMKTTAVRKLLPESFGFLCPVHTPDGPPCGLLNHLASLARITTRFTEPTNIVKTLISLGMLPITNSVIPTSDTVGVLLNGELVGFLSSHSLLVVSKDLRNLKIQGYNNMPKIFEICAIPQYKEGGGPYPGLFISTEEARPIRPVNNLSNQVIEYVSPMEQVFMEIAITDADIRSGVTSHKEVHPTAMLSVLASLTPFSDFNQSPRNMYQCQMGKQTMGDGAMSIEYRTDGKLYRLITPQVPITQNQNEHIYRFDDFPNGTNAVVAVISYTGYDMEDGMIINKDSYDRGFCHGCLYKTEMIDLTEDKFKKNHVHFLKPPIAVFSKRDQADQTIQRLDSDGLPPVGLKVNEGDALYCYFDELVNKAIVHRHKSAEPAYVDQVRIIGSDSKFINKVSIKLRYTRNPVVGDKFSSRHGQKGTLSLLWPQRDMPFTESGITPDCIINPHAFPSRMTIGMLIESLAGKSGALHGIFQDSTPFQFSEKHTALQYFGEQLKSAGFNYYGNEPMYSGTLGNELTADIYIGVVYYQRLRHMVSDKSQVRSTGPINQLTRQPVKGRKKHGGIRFGEMERDSLISHGAAFLLRDRLMNCSDRHVAYVCNKCGSLLSTHAVKPDSLYFESNKRKFLCRYCQSTHSCTKVVLPFVYRYLVNELAGMNIKVHLDLTK